MNHGSLRVWWVPQIPMKSFKVNVANLVEAKLILNTLAEYDVFQFENNVKPDYSNDGGLQVFDANDDYDAPVGSWVDWHSIDGEDIDNFSMEQLATSEPEWEMKSIGNPT